MKEKLFDVTSLGSTMIRLSVPPGERLETASTLEIRTAGTESNTMVALSRMGKRTAWVSRLQDNTLGRRIAGEITRYGVDTKKIVWTEEDRNEVFFVEYGSSPRPIQVIYDREHSAVSKVKFEDLDMDYLLNTKIVHLTGIFAALSENCSKVLHELIDTAKNADIKVSFDVNYRSKLWSPEDACRVISPMLQKSDIIMFTSEDAEQVFGISGTPEEMASKCQNRFKPEITVITLGGEGGIAFDGNEFYRTCGYNVEVQDRLGAGDCFSAGILCGYLEGSLQLGMDYAGAMAALKMGIKGDYFVSDRSEVMSVVRSSGGREVGR